MEDNTVKFGKETFVGKLDGVFLDHYEVIRSLGKGGYGKVYEVKNKKTREIRACKHLSKLNIENLDKFEREINILIKADHPNIIKLYEIFESQRSLYLVMEECKGGEVFDRIIEHIQSKQMYSEKDAANMFLQVMSSIEYCHNQGICHRDLKPENLLYLNKGDEKDNPIKVIDFGLSQIFRERKLKTKVGTAYYVAPEVLKGDYTQLCDIWSAGVILYIFLSGDPPFNGPNDSAIYSKIAQMKFNFPEKKWKNISEEAKDLISHMLVPEKDRYNAKQVLSHPWFKNASNTPLVDLNFDPMFFADYVRGSGIKKMALLFISSRLDENEISDLKKIFEAFDKKKDGQISFNELKQGLVQLKSSHINEQDVFELFKTIDSDKNGRIDYTEFLASTLKKKSYLRQERLYEAFTMFDKNNNGCISKKELMEVLRTEKQQEKEIEKYIKEADKNGDGEIDYKEFLILMGFNDGDDDVEMK
jgi:calcium-dependent protein kinase